MFWIIFYLAMFAIGLFSLCTMPTWGDEISSMTVITVLYLLSWAATLTGIMKFFLLL